jgi:hypothetical protein
MEAVATVVVAALHFSKRLNKLLNRKSDSFRKSSNS